MASLAIATESVARLHHTATFFALSSLKFKKILHYFFFLSFSFSFHFLETPSPPNIKSPVLRTSHSYSHLNQSNEQLKVKKKI